MWPCVFWVGWANEYMRNLSMKSDQVSMRSMLLLREFWLIKNKIYLLKKKWEHVIFFLLLSYRKCRYGCE